VPPAVSLPRITLLAALPAGGPAAAADPAGRHPDLPLIPWPKPLERDDGRMALGAESRVVVGDHRLRPLAGVLADEVATRTGLKLPVAAGAGRPGDVAPKINPAVKAGEPVPALRDREVVRTTDGAHTIAVGVQAVVEGFDDRAAAEGTATLLQLRREGGGAYSLPRLRVKDWPHADCSGVMPDVARADHPVEAVKKVVEICRSTRPGTRNCT
jgi:hypothetical protein